MARVGAGRPVKTFTHARLLTSIALFVLGALALVLTANPAQAGCACGRWSAPPASFNVCALAPNTGCDNSPYAPTVREAITHWNYFVDQWRTPLGAAQQIGPRDGRNSIGFLDRISVAILYGVGLPGNVAAVTLYVAQGGGPAGNAACPLAANVRCPTFGDVREHDVDVILLSDIPYTLDEELAYLGQRGRVFPSFVSLRQVVMHEAGHAHGMMHESRFAAVMYPTQLGHRGVDLTSDDVSAARAYLPALATQTDDLAVMGFAFDAGAYREPEVGGMARPRAGVDSVTVRRFSIYNRGDTATGAPVVYTFRIGNVVAGQGQCPALGAHGVCTILQNQNVPVPLRAPGGDQPLTVEIDGWPGEPHPASNRVQLGTVAAIVAAVLPPEQDAAVVDAEVVDAEVVDAEVIDAEVVDAEVIDAEVVDAEVIDARIVDARIVDARIVDARIVDARVVDARVVDAEVIDAEVIDAEVIDAEVIDARIVDARIVDAEAVDARVVDARVLDALPDLDALELDAAVITPDAQRDVDARVDDARVIVPIFPDFELFDARVLADGGDGAVVVFDDARLFDAARPMADGPPEPPVDAVSASPDGPAADARAGVDGDVTADLGADVPTVLPPEVDADADDPPADARLPVPVADANPDADADTDVDAGRTKTGGGAAGGCSCDVRSRPVDAFWGLTALAVLGLRRTRRRGPVSPTSAGSAGSA
jgi:hypothetical protein